MKSWQGASEHEVYLFETISQFLLHRSDLIDFLFHSNQPRLRGSPEILLDQSLGLCSSDQFLVRLAVHLWSGGGEISLSDLFKIDAETFLKVLGCLEALGPKQNKRFDMIMALVNKNNRV